MKLDMIKFNKIEINFAVLLKVVNKHCSYHPLSPTFIHFRLAFKPSYTARILEKCSNPILSQNPCSSPDCQEGASQGSSGTG